MNEKISSEIIWRYKFIYENIEYVMMPFIGYSNITNKNDFIINKRIPYELLNLGQDFLLNDAKAEFSEFVKYVERRKRDLEYKKKLASTTITQNKESLVWEYFNSIIRLIMINERNMIAREQKLKSMDEYYKILNYRNVCDAEILGSKLIEQYFKDERKKLGNFWSRTKDKVNLRTSDFVKYVSDKRNYDLESQGILTNKERQDIYLTFHDEIAWDTKIKCEVDKNTIYKPRTKHLLRQDINPPCGEEFYLVESRMFINPKELCSDYYQSCPKCGYVVNVPQTLLPEEVKRRIEERCLNYEYEFSTMLLSAELRSLDYQHDVLVRKRTK